MKILLASHGFPPNQTAGAEWRTYRTARWLSERGHSVQVLAIDNTDCEDDRISLIEEIVDGFRVQRLSFKLDLTTNHQAEFNNPIVYQTLSEIFARENIDIFHLISGYRMTGSAIQSAWDAQIPVVVSLTDFWFLCPQITLRRTTGELCCVPEDTIECVLCLKNKQRRYRFPHRITKGRMDDLLRKFWQTTDFLGASNLRKTNEFILTRRQFLHQTLSKVDKLISPSKFLAKIFQEQGVSSEQITVLRQGVNIEQKPINPNYQPGKPLTFGYIGQLAAHKGVDIIVKAFQQLPYNEDQIKLIIYGNQENAWPPFLKKLKRKIAGDSRIVFGGYFANTEARQVYTGLDMLVVPSIWYENSPNVILEAFACGTPIMASDLGGMAELVEHQVNGLLFEPNNVDNLIITLNNVILGPEQLTRWRRKIHQVKSVNEEMAELEKIYTKTQ